MNPGGENSNTRTKNRNPARWGLHLKSSPTRNVAKKSAADMQIECSWNSLTTFEPSKFPMLGFPMLWISRIPGCSILYVHLLIDILTPEKMFEPFLRNDSQYWEYAQDFSLDKPVDAAHWGFLILERSDTRTVKDAWTWYRNKKEISGYSTKKNNSKKEYFIE